MMHQLINLLTLIAHYNNVLLVLDKVSLTTIFFVHDFHYNYTKLQHLSK